MKNQTFDAQMARIKLVTGKRTQVELADFFGIKQSSISSAVQRGKIPQSWLVILMRVRNIHPEWVLTGDGPCYIPTQPEPGQYETGEQYVERKLDDEALKRLPARALAEELVRRIAVSQNEAFCPTQKENLD